MTARWVFDTNVVVSALVFRSGTTARLRWVWASGRAIPLVSRATTDELLRVLRYPKFRLSSSDVEELLGDYLPWAEAVDVSEGVSEGAADVVCADADDQKFLDLAVVGSADGVVTGDGHLLAVKDAAPFDVVTPSAFMRRVQGP